MKIGLNGTGLVQQASIELIQKDVHQAHQEGFDSYWLAEHPSGGFDALTILAVVGQAVKGIELGTAIIPTFPRHPMVLAGQTLTTQSATGDRFTLGIGLSHQVMMAQLGINFDKPIRHLREYLTILMPLLETGKVSFKGDILSCDAQLFQTPDKRPCVVVAALGPQALRVAGTRTDGTTLAWVGSKTIRNHIVPTIGAAASKAGKSHQPRIIATLPVCVSDQPDKVKSRISQTMAMYAQLPSYQAMFEREGVDQPGEVALVGSKSQLEDQLHGLELGGVTDFAASIFATSKDEHLATREFLSDYIQKK